MKYFLVMVLISTATLWAQPRWIDDDSAIQAHREGGVVKMLKLTDDQQKQFDKLQSELQKKQIALRSKLETMQIDLREIFRADKPDQGKIESQISDISKVQNEMKLNHVGHWFSIDKMLTPEQQMIWREHRPMMEMRGGMKGSRGEMRPFHGGRHGHGEGTRER